MIALAEYLALSDQISVAVSGDKGGIRIAF